MDDQPKSQKHAIDPARQNIAVADGSDDNLKHMHTGDDPVAVRERALKIIGNPEANKSFDTSNIDLVKAMSLDEFENGVLLANSLPELSRTLAIDLMRKIQKEYLCTTPSEKATAELAALSYVRTLDIQRRITNYLEIGTFTDLGVHYLDMLSKELDRANRHYLTAIQTLRTMKQPPLQFNIRADTAVVGQNQVVQTNQ